MIRPKGSPGAYIFQGISRLMLLRSSFDVSDASWDRHLPSARIDLPFVITWQVKSTECVSSSFSYPVSYEEAPKPTSERQSNSTQTINATSHTQVYARAHTHI